MNFNYKLDNDVRPTSNGRAYKTNIFNNLTKSNYYKKTFYLLPTSEPPLIRVALFVVACHCIFCNVT